MNGNERVLLIGMMGTGKSTVGHALVARTGWAYVDNDAELERVAGEPTLAVFDSEGPDALHALEVRVLMATLQRPPPLVAGAAASVVLSGVARTLLKENAYVVWLRARIETLAKRVGEGEGRAWLKPDPESALRELYEGRAPLYEEVADLIVDVDDISPDEVVDRILSALTAR